MMSLNDAALAERVIVRLRECARMASDELPDGSVLTDERGSSALVPLLMKG